MSTSSPLIKVSTEGRESVSPSASTVFEISCRLRAGDVSVGFSCDGEKTVLLDESSVVKVTKAEASAQFISIKSDNFIDVLNKKLEIKKM